MIKHLFILLTTSISLIAAIQPTTYTYKTVGDLAIQLDVYVPTVTLYDKYPVIFVIHGGGYVAGSKANALSPQELAEWLSRGWVVVSIDYRFAPAAFLDDMIEDIQDAYQWVRTELAKVIPINPDSIALWGGSAGGGLVEIGGYMLTPRPIAVISFYPGFTNFTDYYVYNPNTPVTASLAAQAKNLSQPVADYNFTGPNDPRGVFFGTALIEQKMGWIITTQDPNESIDYILAVLTEYSGVYNVDANFPPTFLAHGLNDTLVPYTQSVEMAIQLQQKNVSYVLDLVPNAGHGFDFGNVTPEMWQKYILPAFDFAQQYVTSDSKAKTIISI